MIDARADDLGALEALVEHVARAIHDARGLCHADDARMFEPLSWEECAAEDYPVEAEYARTLARAAIAELRAARARLDAPADREGMWPSDAEFQNGDKVTTPRAPFWSGTICGWYRNSDGRLGFNVEADAIPLAIHNYPQSGLRALARGDHAGGE